MIQRKGVEFDRYPVVPNEMHLHFPAFRETEGRKIPFHFWAREEIWIFILINEKWERLEFILFMLQFCRWVFGSGYFQHNIDIVRYCTFCIARGIQFVFFTISSFPSFSLSTLYVGNTLDIRLGSLSWCLGHIFLFACRPAQLYTLPIINIHPYIFHIYS